MDRGLDKRSSTGGRISSILSNAKKSTYRETNTSKAAENIDPEILDILGLDDTSDLDYGEYKTLLKEQMIADRMKGNKTKTTTDEKLTNEYKRVKANTGKFVINSSNVKQNTYTPRTRRFSNQSNL